MAFDATPGGDPRGPLCKACKQPIEYGQVSRRIDRDDDEHDLNGVYHAPCSKPLMQLVNAIDMLRKLQLD